jgi:hypothetical protein
VENGMREGAAIRALYFSPSTLRTRAASGRVVCCRRRKRSLSCSLSDATVRLRHRRRGKEATMQRKRTKERLKKNGGRRLYSQEERGNSGLY